MEQCSHFYIMVFSYNWLQQYSSEKLPKPHTLAELLSLHAFQVEEVRKVKGDWLLDVDILPNRAHDCLCHTGVAREIAAIQKSTFKSPAFKSIRAQKGTLAPLQVKIQDSSLVPRYAAIVVEGVQVRPSPKKVRQLLETVGVNSINNIVDLTNFVMLEMGQPMHAFDYDEIQGHTMTVRQAKEGEQLKTLDNQTFHLPGGALVIEDANRLIDLAGVKGGEVSGIKNRTRNIVLQAANFDSATIYTTKRSLKYTTCAATMYAHGISSELPMPALERAHFLLGEFGIQGKVVHLVDLYPKKERPTNVFLDMARVRSVLGISISQQEAARILRLLGCKVLSQKNRLAVVAPARRLDLTIPEDLIEELGRIKGYEKIPSAPSLVSLASPPASAELVWTERIRDVFLGLGFAESYNYSFWGIDDFTMFGFQRADLTNLVALENPVSEHFSHLRSSLLEHILKNTKTAQNHAWTPRIFEIGKVFRMSSGSIQETQMLGAAAAGANFYEMKGMCDILFQALGIAEAWYDDYEPTPEHSSSALWQKGRCAELKVNSQEIGFVGEISSNIQRALKSSKSIGALHLNVDKLVQLATEERMYQAPPKFPSAFRDIAVFVPVPTKVAELMNVIHDAGGELVQDIDLFDVYEEEAIAGGKKSLAFHIVYQAQDRTLNAQEVDALHRKIIEAIEQNPEWEVRK